MSTIAETILGDLGGMDTFACLPKAEAEAISVVTRPDELKRFEFEDGSSLICYPEMGIDVGFADGCFCWKGAGHHPAYCTVE